MMKKPAALAKRGTQLIHQMQVKSMYVQYMHVYEGCIGCDIACISCTGIEWMGIHYLGRMRDQAID